MGQGATAGRRALIAHVQKCIDLANGVSGDLGVVRDANNALAQQTSKDVSELRGRLDIQKEWLTRVEAQAEAAHNAADAVRLEWHLFFGSLTLMERVRFLLFGTLPPLKPANPVHARTSGEMRRALADLTRKAEGRRAETVPTDGVRASASMAPRPLP